MTPMSHSDRVAPRPVLDDRQLRVLGCLLEKERTTPEDYPLTANALMRACNQSTSRDPVVAYDQRTVETTVTDLKALGLVRFVHTPSGRAITRYRHVLDEAWALGEPELAVLGVLMLRGAQTPGELKARTERLWRFTDLGAVESALATLAGQDDPLVAAAERRPGQKEVRWHHLLGGAPVPVAGTVEPLERSAGGSGGSYEPDGPDARAAATAPLGGSMPPDPDRVVELERRVAELEAQVARLFSEFGLD